MRKWTSDEIAIVKEYYPSHGKEWNGWNDLLPDRGKTAIAACASKHGFTNSSKAPYTKAEDQAIIDNYPVHGSTWDGWRQILPNRSVSAIKNRAMKLGVTMRPEALSEIRRMSSGGSMHWTPEQDELIGRHYPTYGSLWEGWRELLPGRTARAISKRANDIGVHRYQKKPNLFTDGQRAYILKGVIAIADGLAVSPVMIADEIERMRREFENERV